MSETNRLTGEEHRDDFLIDMGFTSVEIARVQAIRDQRKRASRVGERFGKWTVLWPAAHRPSVQSFEVVARCICGRISIVPLHDIVNGRSGGCHKCFDVKEKSK